MNLFLHGIGPDDGKRTPPIKTDDALRSEPSELVDVVLTNPPFGKKSSITVINDEGETDKESITYNRPDFWTTTSNKQLNVQDRIADLRRHVTDDALKERLNEIANTVKESVSLLGNLVEDHHRPEVEELKLFEYVELRMKSATSQIDDIAKRGGDQ